ncbi:MAG: cystathionine beta-lyase/cystathionine gamma-synthase [Bacteroidia bacterium]|jgi:cystathionine beta-lyase/cystathionine gamma-synthase
MEDHKVQNYIKDVCENMPVGWLNLTTHRLDVYDEKLAKSQFLEQFEILYNANNSETSALQELPTAFDYIRLGHPLSCILEWVLAKANGLDPNKVISFSSKTMPILAILRKNYLDKKNTQIVHTGTLPDCFDVDVLQNIYGYIFSVQHVELEEEINEFNGTTIFVSQQEDLRKFNLGPNIDFCINIHQPNGSGVEPLGSVVAIMGKPNEGYVSEIQHVRRRETIAITPANALKALKLLSDHSVLDNNRSDVVAYQKRVLASIASITGSNTKALVASSGLSVQYAILMGLIHDAVENHKGKAIKIVVPPNCYGGTNDQARRVAASMNNVEVLDMAVDGGQDMVQSIDAILDELAKEDAIPYIIAEIPTNPRVEVPDLIQLKEVLKRERRTSGGAIAIDPVFILDQTFCPNVHFLGEGEILSTIRTISFASGSKFPSGGLCTAGYCIGNTKTDALMNKIAVHLKLCDNEATDLQYEILAKQMPSMNQRIQDAYTNTRKFVNFINQVLPSAKINFVSEELAEKGFTPSVFSLDLPTKGSTDEEKESYKRALNLKLIYLMISEIPNESKYCVSYGQLKGCYWTIPATSTQGTTKEGDKDYIARVALSGNMDLELHKKIFLSFVEGI